jgi:hypothetical protein
MVIRIIIHQAKNVKERIQHSTFKSANLGSEVFAALQSLRTLTDQLASSLERKVTPANATEIASGTSEVDSAYSSAIALYTT